jgi:hypothetical protein
MHVLIASSSAYRRGLYQEAVQGLGHEASLADGGVDCVAQIRRRRPDFLLLEAPLLWGGSDGVLEVLTSSLELPSPRVVVVAVGPGSIDWFQLSRFHVSDVLFRLPTKHELQRALVCSPPAGGHTDQPNMTPARTR